MFEKYFLPVAAAAVLALGVTVFFQHRVINSLQAENAVLEQRVGDKDATIAAQSAGIDDMIKAATAAGETLKSAGDRIDTLNAQLAAERAKRNAALEADYAVPDCAALLATDLAAVCPAHARRLRESAGLSGP